MSSAGAQAGPGGSASERRSRSASSGSINNDQNGKTTSKRAAFARSPSPGPGPSTLKPPPGVPSWLTIWSKPTVASALLAERRQMRDFVATPVPASSTMKRRGVVISDVGSTTGSTTATSTTPAATAAPTAPTAAAATSTAPTAAAATSTATTTWASSRTAPARPSSAGRRPPNQQQHQQHQQQLPETRSAPAPPPPPTAKAVPPRVPSPPSPPQHDTNNTSAPPPSSDKRCLSEGSGPSCLLRDDPSGRSLLSYFLAGGNKAAAGGVGVGPGPPGTAPSLPRSTLVAARFRRTTSSANGGIGGGGGSGGSNAPYGSAPSWAWAPTTPQQQQQQQQLLRVGSSSRPASPAPSISSAGSSSSNVATGARRSSANGFVTSSSSSSSFSVAGTPRRPQSAGPRSRTTHAEVTAATAPAVTSAAPAAAAAPAAPSAYRSSSTSSSAASQAVPAPAPPRSLVRSVTFSNPLTCCSQPPSSASSNVAAGGPMQPAIRMRPMSASSSTISSTYGSSSSRAHQSHLRQATSTSSAAAAGAGAGAAGAAAGPMTPRSASPMGSANRPAARVGGNVSSGGPAAASAAASAATTAAAAAAAVGRAVGVWEAAQRPRGPCSDLRLILSGPDEARDKACKADEGDLMLARPRGGGGAGRAAGGGEGEARIPLPIHVMLTGSLQELYDRILRSGERPLHFSLGGVTFSGDLDPEHAGTLRIRNRTLILHNCTLAFKPGQKLWVGPGGHLVLADVSVVTATRKSVGRGAPGGKQGGRGMGATAAAAAGGAAGGAGVGGRGVGVGVGVPLLHVAGGGRCLLRGCRVKVYPGEGRAAAGHNDLRAWGEEQSPRACMAPQTPLTAGPYYFYQQQPPPPPDPHYQPPQQQGCYDPCQHDHPHNHHRHSTQHHSFTSTTSSSSLDANYCILTETGGTLEAVGCRLGRCIATGANTSLTLRRCRVKPGRACAAYAPLLLVTSNASLQAYQTEIREGPASGISAEGEATRVSLAQCSVSCCRRNAVTLLSGAQFSAVMSRLYDNRVAGIVVRGGSTVADLTDCEVTGNLTSNVTVKEGAALVMLRCTSVGCVEGTGMLVEGAGTRALAELCNFDNNEECGVHVRGGAALELQDCSASSNAIHGVEIEGMYDKAAGAKVVAEATLAALPPPMVPLPNVFCLVAGGQLAKNGSHGCAVVCGGGLRVSGCELSQNVGDGAYADGLGCELVLHECLAFSNKESGVFVCSGGAVWGDDCRLGGNLH
ncbi:hypothetical protein Agub_g9835, partial [Astrephomene gubernaculifera]